MIPLLAIIIFMMNFFSSLQPWKGGARYHAFFFLHFRLAWVVQGKHKLSHPSTSSTVLAREGFASGGLWPPGVLSLPFQAL